MLGLEFLRLTEEASFTKNCGWLGAEFDATFDDECVAIITGRKTHAWLGIKHVMRIRQPLLAWLTPDCWETVQKAQARTNWPRRDKTKHKCNTFKSPSCLGRQLQAFATDRAHLLPPLIRRRLSALRDLDGASAPLGSGAVETRQISIVDERPGAA